MTSPIFRSPVGEASTRIAFTGNRIDRQAENRSDDAAQRALSETGARLLLCAQGRLCLRVNGEPPFHPFFSVQEARDAGAALDEAILLGHDASGPVLVVPGPPDLEALPASIKAIDYRSIYIQGLLQGDALGALAQGAALLAWNQNHRFCGRCGARTEMRAGGYKRACTGCEAEHFPRTDPVVIMLAIREDNCLLGRSPHFVPGMVSCLAGFVEPGETIEGAVRREVFEESGITVGQVAYHASQPWPFPYSLMIGCYGEATSSEIRFDDNELEDCGWYSRQAVRAMLEGDPAAAASLPPPGAIANRLIRDWVECF